MEQVAISVERLSVQFPGSWRKRGVVALDAVDLQVRRGQIVALLGPNGSGKTTLLRVLSGQQRPTSGRARVLDREPSARESARRVGYQPDATLPFRHLSGAELLAYAGALRGLPSTQVNARAAVLLEQLGLTSAGNRRVRHYSTGMQRRLGFAVALLGEPDVLLLDEPTAGLDPNGSARVCDMLRAAADRGCTVVLASHQLLEVEQISDAVHVLHGGRIARHGTIDEVLGTEDDQLTVRGLAADARGAVEAAVEAQGAEPIGWSRRRRHLFSLFREFDDR